MKIIFTLFTIILITCTSWAQPWYVWTQKTPPPFGTNGRNAHDLFSINGLVYLVMGSDSGAINTYNDVWEYTPTTDSWSQKGVFPYQGSYGTSTFVINNEAYTVGGWWRQGTTANHLIACNYKFTPATNSFTPITAFPDADRYTGVAFTINGKGYFGTGFSPVVNDLWEFDTTAGTWTQMASLPGTARQGAFGFSIGNYGYIGSGNSPSGTCYTDLWRYDPVANSWLQRTSFPGAPRSACAVFVLGNEAFIIGGTNFVNSAFNQVFKYNAPADSWLFIGAFPGGPRYASMAASANGKGYFGQGRFSNQALNEYYTMNDWWEFEIVTGVGIDENTNDNENFLSIYPNPASSEITLNAGVKMLPSLINIYDMKGQLVQTLNPVSEKITVDVSRYAPGNYIVQASSGKKIITQKFVKE
jgi:N-acetylneuraminic acid mutarotase